MVLLAKFYILDITIVLISHRRQRTASRNQIVILAWRKLKVHNLGQVEFIAPDKKIWIF